MKTADPCPPTLYFDGSCPVCSREVAMYRQQTGAERLCWIDASSCDSAQLGPGLTREAALARLHLRQADGRLVSGAQAFTNLWQNLPAWSPLGRILGAKPVLPLLEAGYRIFLFIRRSWRRPV